MPALSAAAAVTMFSSAGFTSSHLRVFRPQSGFTRNCLTDSHSLALASSASISDPDGTRGEWMS